MKSTIVIASLVIIAASCNSKPKTEADKKEPVDTAGFAAYQAQKLQEQLNEGGIPEEGEQQDQSSSTAKKPGTNSTTSRGGEQTAANNNSSNSNETNNS